MQASPAPTLPPNAGRGAPVSNRSGSPSRAPVAARCRPPRERTAGRYAGARIIWWIAALLAIPLAARAAAPDRLAVVATNDRLLWNGVAVLPDGRLFVDFPRIDPAVPNPSLAELKPDGTAVPFPGGAWNGWKPGADPANAFVSVNAVHVGPDGRLWVVDNAASGFIGKPPVPGGQKVVVIDPRTGAIVRVYRLGGDVLRPKSAIDDIRFNGRHAYVTDAGAPGLLVLDLDTGAVRRVLDDDTSTTAKRPAIVDGHILRGPDGKPARINADQLEVTPDGAYLYYQPLPGPLYRIGTGLLDDPAVRPAKLSGSVEFWYDTPSLGGTAIDAAGNLYLNDLGTDSILKLGPDRHLTLVIHDARLHWADAPIITDKGDLLVPVPQLDRSKAFNHGHSEIQWPVAIYRLHLGARPPGNQ